MFSLSNIHLISIGLNVLINNYLLKMKFIKFEHKEFCHILHLKTYWSNINIQIGSVFENQISLIKHCLKIISNNYNDYLTIKNWIKLEFKNDYHDNLENFVINMITSSYPNDLIILCKNTTVNLDEEQPEYLSDELDTELGLK